MWCRCVRPFSTGAMRIAAHGSFHPDHQHRVRVSAVPGRSAQVSLRLRWRWRLPCWLRTALADDCSDAGRLPVAGRTGARPRGRHGTLRPPACCVRGPLRAIPRRLRRPAGMEPAVSHLRVCGICGRGSQRLRPVAPSRTGFLPDRRHGSVPPARAGAGGNAHRADRDLLQPGGKCDSGNHSRTRSRAGARQHRLAESDLRNGVRRQCHDRHGGRRDPRRPGITTVCTDRVHGDLQGAWPLSNLVFFLQPAG